MDLGESLWQPFEKVAARAHSRPVERIRILLRQGMGKRVCCMTASMRGRGGSSGHGCFRMSRALFSGSASPRAHCLRPRRARRDAAAAAAQCALQCMLAVKQRRRLTERVLSVLNVRGPSTGRVGRLSGCQARAALAHTPSIFRWSFFFYYSPVFLPQDPVGPDVFSLTRGSLSPRPRSIRVTAKKTLRIPSQSWIQAWLTR